MHRRETGETTRSRRRDGADAVASAVVSKRRWPPVVERRIGALVGALFDQTVVQQAVERTYSVPGCRVSVRRSRPSTSRMMS